jgi:hypothetical protein
MDLTFVIDPTFALYQIIDPVTTSVLDFCRWADTYDLTVDFASKRSRSLYIADIFLETIGQ